MYLRSACDHEPMEPLASLMIFMGTQRKSVFRSIHTGGHPGAFSSTVGVSSLIVFTAFQLSYGAHVELT